MEYKEQIAILDFGSQYTHIIARRIRDLGVFCEIHPHDTHPSVLTSKKTKGVILSGGPNSVQDTNALHTHPDLWEWNKKTNIPVLGICYGMQEITIAHGGSVTSSDCTYKEYGSTNINIKHNCPFLNNIYISKDVTVWMSHDDHISTLPIDFVELASTDKGICAAFSHKEYPIFGVQFHPEVSHTSCGKQLLHNFVVEICHIEQLWNMETIVEPMIKSIRQMVGNNAHVIGAVSGGVDSTVAAMIMCHAIGSRFHAVMVDNGCLRKDEEIIVIKRLRGKLGIDIVCLNESDMFINALKGITDPEEKRKIIGASFIQVFQDYAKTLKPKPTFLLQGTLYPDVIESSGSSFNSKTIKTHHNVGGLPENMNMTLIEPLRELFKDEVRKLGVVIGIDHESLYRHPFPGPGLAIRVIGEVTKKRLDTIRHADDIAITEIRRAGIYDNISQAFVVLLPIKSVGVMGDSRTYEDVAVLRCVTTCDFMTADWYPMDTALQTKISGRIINEVNGINRVCYDISSKPPATIEWE